MLNVEDVLGEFEDMMAPYVPITDVLESFKLTDNQISAILLMIYNYRFINTIDNT